MGTKPDTSYSQQLDFLKLAAVTGLLLAMLWSSSAVAQNLEWATQASGTNNDTGSGIAVDSLGNSYATGTFEGTITFGAGQPNQTVLTSAGNRDLYIAKYNGAGELVWAKRAGGANPDQAAAIAVDASGNSYVAGLFLGASTFGAGETNETGLTSTNSADIFIAKYDVDGELVWAKQAGGYGFDQGFSVAVDGSGSSYMTGQFAYDPVFGAGESNETALLSSNDDIFIAKYDADGDLVWAKSVGGGPQADWGYGIAVDVSGNSYVTGSFQGTATFAPGEINAIELTSTAGRDIFVAKYDTSGNFLWVKKPSGTGIFDSGASIGVDGGGNIYVTGAFYNSMTFGAGETNEIELTSDGDSADIFVAKYDGAGGLEWAKRAGGTDIDDGLAIAVESSGESLVSGRFSTSATFGMGESNETTLVSQGNRDIFVAKYDVDGKLVWARQAGGSYSDYALGAAVDVSGNGYVTGLFGVSATFGAGEENETVVSTGTFTNGVFIAKYAGDDAPGNDDDDDGVLDGSDACPNTAADDQVDAFGCSQAQVDGDGDGVCNSDAPAGATGPAPGCSGSDACPGTPEGETPNEFGCSASQLDSDVDGVFDDIDNCPFIPNPGQADNEGDGQGDVCDPDDDNDGVLDIEDNCPLAPNAGQADNEGDGLGDVCDPDDDNDGVLDIEDNCPTVANPFQEQTGNNVGGEHGDACVSPDVTIGKGGTVEPGAVIETGAVINQGTFVGAGAYIGANTILARNSTVEQDAVVDADSEVRQGSTVEAGAIIGKNVLINQDVDVHAGAKVGDNSIVGKNSDIFADAVIGCFAAPTSFTPVCPGAAIGTTLGQNVEVGAGATVADGAVIPKNTILP